MKPYVPITAAILVPLLAMGPSCATTAPRQQLRLAFLDGDDGASEEDQGVVDAAPAPIIELSDAEVAEGFRALARDPRLIAFFRQPEGMGLHLVPASHVLGDAFVPGYHQLCATRGQPADCLGLLGDGAFDTDDRQHDRRRGRRNAAEGSSGLQVPSGVQECYGLGRSREGMAPHCRAEPRSSGSR